MHLLGRALLVNAMSRLGPISVVLDLVSYSFCVWISPPRLGHARFIAGIDLVVLAAFTLWAMRAAVSKGAISVFKALSVLCVVVSVIRIGFNATNGNGETAVAYVLYLLCSIAALAFFQWGAKVKPY
jgi:hypothetical protein